jgi:hypothetical protein
MATLNQQSMTVPIFNEEGALLVVIQAKKEASKISEEPSLNPMTRYESAQKSNSIELELIKIEVDVTEPDSKF